MIIADVSVPASVIPPGSVLTDTNTRIEFVQHVSVDDGSQHYFRVVDSADLDTFERAARADPRVVTLSAIDRTSPSPLYRIEWTAPPPCPALYRLDLLVERMSAAPDGWTFRVHAGSLDALRDLQRDCRDAAIPLGVERLDYSSDDGDPDPYGLTPKQRVVLLAAIEAGYFAVPRETTLAGLAAQFDVSDQAISERLRRGQRNLMRATVLADVGPSSSPVSHHPGRPR